MLIYYHKSLKFFSMLDIEFIKNNASYMKQVLINKNSKISIDDLLSIYDKRKNLLNQVEVLRKNKNQIADQMKNIKDLAQDEKIDLINKGKDIKQNLNKLESDLDIIDKEYLDIMLKVPNFYSEDTPIGKNETENKILRQVGIISQFDFDPKEHWELGEKLNLINIQKSAVISGSRFAYLMGDLVRLQFGIVQMVFDTLTNQEILKEIMQKNNLEVSDTPFIPVIPPVLMRPEVMDRMGRLHPMDERYQTTIDGLMLVGSAEHTLGPLHMDELINIKENPIRYVGYSTAFRREAGTYGKDMKGILRLHQFDKIEIETFTTKENGFVEQDFIVAIQEYLVQQLELPYQIVLKCTGDMGNPDIRALDIETWMPGQNQYRETHTSDYMGDFQARRLKTQYLDKNGNREFAHMNDATAFAIGRILIAIMENYQTKEGYIRIPKVLQKYLGKDLIK